MEFQTALEDKTGKPRAFVGLSIFGDEPDFSYLESLLGAPDKTHRKGDHHALGNHSQDRFGVSSPLPKTAELNSI